MAVLQSTVITYIARAQRALADFGYQIAIKEKVGENPVELYIKVRYLSSAIKALSVNNDLTSNEKQRIIDLMIAAGQLYKYSAVPLSFGTNVVNILPNSVTNITNNYVSTITQQNTLWVFNNGVNGTAARNRPDLPFLTVTAAEAAAVSGDIIVIGPGVYTTGTHGKNGVKYHLMMGARISSGAVTTWLIDGISIEISGDGYFDTTDALVFDIKNSGSVKGECFYINRNSAPTVTEDCVKVASSSTIKLNIKTGLDSSGNGINIGTGCAVSITAKSSYCYKHAIKVVNSDSSADHYVSIDEVSIAIGIADSSFISFDSSGAFLFEGRIRWGNSSSTKGCIALMSGTGSNGRLTVDGEIVQTSGSAQIIYTDASTNHILDLTAKVLNQAGQVVIAAASVTVNIYDKIEGSRTTALVVLSAGTLTGLPRIKNGASNANAHGILMSGGTLQLDNTTFIITHASALGINAASPFDVNIVGIAQGNRDLSGNINRVGGDYNYNPNFI